MHLGVKRFPHPADSCRTWAAWRLSAVYIYWLFRKSSSLSDLLAPSTPLFRIAPAFSAYLHYARAPRADIFSAALRNPFAAIRLFR
jgi:hypothetical protein